ncbi:MAG: 50S ribosomal protein L25/general stress protein Ctc [Chlamydiales bacterium]|nr:50S ribosomal protein L25/general stress protein Ctc [Chlamydiia bacterium]MCP5508311.1 50S ribosomal protein L25/general stress protein Ctc [Chlamydiales bacterium]
MKLTVSKRAADKKSDSKRLRREGKIPAVVYNRGNDSESIAVDANAFMSALRNITKGRLATTQFALVDADGKERKAIVKEIQYHPTTYDVLHLDFEELKAGERINVKVPIEFNGVVDCIGIKLGGVLRQVIRSVLVECNAENIPEAFTLNVAKMSMGETLRLSDIEMAETIRPRANMNEVAVAIVKR